MAGGREQEDLARPPPVPAKRTYAPHTLPPAPVQEKKAQAAAAMKKVEAEAAPQKEKPAAVKEPAASPSKVNPQEACGLLLGGAKPNAATAPVAKAAPVLKPAAPTPPAAKTAPPTNQPARSPSLASRRPRSRRLRPRA